jgi:hypothetical protein
MTTTTFDAECATDGGTWSDQYQNVIKVRVDQTYSSLNTMISTVAPHQMMSRDEEHFEIQMPPEYIKKGYFKVQPGAIRRTIPMEQLPVVRSPIRILVDPVSRPAPVRPAISATPGVKNAGSQATPKPFIKQQEHMAFLKRVSMGENSPITPQTALLAQKAWQKIWKATDCKMPVPAACTGPDGEMFYSWDCGRHHLELEIIPGKPAEFFYRDRETEYFWGEDYNIGESLSPEAVEKLKLFS